MTTDYWSRFSRFGIAALLLIAGATGIVALIIGFIAPDALVFHVLTVVGGAVGFSSTVGLFDSADDPDAGAQTGEQDSLSLVGIVVLAFALNIWVAIITSVAIGAAARGAADLALFIAIIGPALDLFILKRTGWSIITLSYRAGLRVVPPLIGLSSQSVINVPFGRLFRRTG
ncbi:hypothetical protein BRD20_10185 [Halobacteriales archaeon SW_8_65_20]|nr:MAG: hypothetical protein BRD20_10185 [Halobacteriales archaeon SW_8_65_20]